MGFPINPSDGDKYRNYYYDGSRQAWRKHHIQGKDKDLIYGDFTVFSPTISNGTWTSVTYNEQFSDTPTLVGWIGNNGSRSAWPRINNSISTGFDCSIQEDMLAISLGSGAHATSTGEKLSWLAIGKTGSNLLSTNPNHNDESKQLIYDSIIGAWRKKKFQFGKYPTLEADITTGYVSKSWPQVFNIAPATMIYAETMNGSAAITTRHNDITVTGFDVKTQEENAGDDNHSPEDISWVAYGSFNNSSYPTSPSDGDQINGYIYSSSHGGWRLPIIQFGIESVAADRATGSLDNFSYDENFESIPTFSAMMNTMNGSETAGTRSSNITASGFDLMCQENTLDELGATNAGGHSTEDIGWFAIN